MHKKPRVVKPKAEKIPKIAKPRVVKPKAEKIPKEPKVKVVKPKAEKVPKEPKPIIESTLSYEYTNSIMKSRKYISDFVTYTFIL